MLDKCEVIAKMAAEDNLQRVNENSAPVNPKSSFYVKYIKRLIDLVVVIPVFLLLLPVNLVLGIITYFDVGSPVFFKQKRTGKDGKPFTIDADNVILSMGYRPSPLAEGNKKLHLVGDCDKVGNLRTVIWQAWDVCMKL